MSVTIKSVSSKYNVSAMIVYLDSNGKCMTENHTIKDSESKGARTIKKAMTEWFNAEHDNCKLLAVENITHTTVKTLSIYTFECNAEDIAALAEQNGIVFYKEDIVK